MFASIHNFKETTCLSTPIITTPIWSLPFELMCDVSDYVVGVVLGQRKDKVFHVIYLLCHSCIK